MYACNLLKDTVAYGDCVRVCACVYVCVLLLLKDTVAYGDCVGDVCVHVCMRVTVTQGYCSLW